MKQFRLFNFTSDQPDGTLSKQQVVETSRTIIRERIQYRESAPINIKAPIFCTKEEFRDYLMDLFKWIVGGAMYKISEQRFRFYLPPVEATVELEFNEIPESGKMSFGIICSGDFPKGNVIKNPNATRENEIDETIDVFDNVGDLHGMGLKFKMDERNPKMTVLWQFNGKAKEDIKENLRVSITGGNGNAVLDKTTRGNNSYSVVRMQNHLIVRGEGKSESYGNNRDVLIIKKADIEGDIIEATFDYDINLWKYRLFKDVIIDDDTRFASETEYDLVRKTLITVGGITVCLDPIGRPIKRR